eukprot:COSAG05_NODE_7060_length_861_cov_1.775591_2_plen_153_part_00
MLHQARRITSALENRVESLVSTVAPPPLPHTLTVARATPLHYLLLLHSLLLAADGGSNAMAMALTVWRACACMRACARARVCGVRVSSSSSSQEDELEALEDENEALQEEVDRASEMQRDTIHQKGAQLEQMMKKLPMPTIPPKKQSLGRRW